MHAMGRHLRSSSMILMVLAALGLGGCVYAPPPAAAAYAPPVDYTYAAPAYYYAPYYYSPYYYPAYYPPVVGSVGFFFGGGHHLH